MVPPGQQTERNMQHSLIAASLLGDYPASGVPREKSIFYGYLAVHFISGSPLLLPVSEEEGNRALREYVNRAYVEVRSLDNRIVALRSRAIADIYLSSDDFDTLGPDDSVYESLGPIEVDPEFWAMANLNLDPPYLLEARFSAEKIACMQTTISDLKEAFPEGNWDELIRSRAQDVIWRYTGGATRVENLDSRMEYDDVNVYTDVIEWFEMRFNADCAMPRLFWSKHAGHRTISINMKAIDYLSAPLHLASARF